MENLEFLPSIGIKGPVVVKDVDERKVMADSNLVIVSIMSRSNLNSSGTELHVDNDRVGDNRESAINERVDSKFSVKVLRVVRTDT